MKKQIATFALVLTAISSAHAAADCGDRQQLDNCDVLTTYTGFTTIGPTVLTGGMTDATSGSHHKIILAAKEDANAFIASEGKILGVQLAATIATLRADLSQLAQASDMQIAQEISAY